MKNFNTLVTKNTNLIKTLREYTRTSYL